MRRLVAIVVAVVLLAVLALYAIAYVRGTAIVQDAIAPRVIR